MPIPSKKNVPRNIPEFSMTKSVWWKHIYHCPRNKNKSKWNIDKVRVTGYSVDESLEPLKTIEISGNRLKNERQYCAFLYWEEKITLLYFTSVSFNFLFFPRTLFLKYNLICLFIMWSTQSGSINTYGEIFVSKKPYKLKFEHSLVVSMKRITAE